MTAVTAQLVDKLGKLKAQIAELHEEEKGLCKLLVDTSKANGQTNFTGKLYDATVISSSKTTLDMVVIRGILTEGFLKQHSKNTPYYSVKVTARKKP